MEDTAAQAFSWIQMGFVALVAVLALIAFVLQVRRRPYNAVALWLRAVLALAIFAVLLLMSGVALNWLWGGVFAVVGAGLGFLAGKTSTVEMGEKGRPVIKKAPWPALVSALGYVMTAVALMYGTGGLFSVSLLVVLFAAMMTVGATISEVTKGGADTSTQGAASAGVAAPDRS